MAQHLATLTLGHASPDTELDLLVQGLCQALDDNFAVSADTLGALLSLAFDEEGVRLDGATPGAG